MANFPPFRGGNGGGAFVFPDKYRFADNNARDTYFPQHLNELKQAKTIVMVGTTPYIWGGSDNPSVYSNTKWDDASFLVKGDKGKKGDSGAGIDLNALKEGELPAWDSKTNTLVPSGVTANDGDIHIAPSSVLFGNHKMSSSIENVIFTNVETGVHYAPLWQEVNPDADDGYVRDYSKATDVVRVPNGNVDVTNPVNRGVIIDKDETFFGGTFTLSQDATNIEMYIEDAQGKEVWRSKLGSLPAGAQTVVFKDPFEIKKGYTYDIYIKSTDGSDVICKSNASTGFSWTVQRSTWRDRSVALRTDIGHMFDKVELQGQALVFTPHSPSNSPTTITLPSVGVDPKTIVGVIRSGTDLVFTHEDGTTTTLSVDEKHTVKTTPKFYGMFSDSWPTTLTGATPAVGNQVIVSRSTAPAQRVFILVPIDHASAVTGIKQGDGLAASWTSNDLTIEGKQYKAFYSPRALVEKSATFTVTFSGGKLYV